MFRDTCCTRGPLRWDDRHSTAELIDHFKHSTHGLNSWTEAQKKVLEEYGFSKGEFEEYKYKTVQRIKNWMKNPKKMRADASMQARCFFVAVGNKTEPTKLDTHMKIDRT